MSVTMRETMTPPTAPKGRKPSRWRWQPVSPKAMFGMFAAVAIAFSLGWITAPNSPPQAVIRAGLPGPTRLGALGIPVGYQDTQAGAVSAASNLTMAPLTPAGRDPSNRETLLSTIATPSGRALLGDGLKAQDATITSWFGSTSATYTLAGTVAATKVESFTPGKAVVDLWVVITTSRPGLTLASAFWGGQRVTLEWIDGDWKASDMDASLSVPIPSSQGAAGDPNTLLKGYGSDGFYTGARG